MNKLAVASITLLMTCAAFAHEGTRIGVVDADIVIQKSAKGKAFFEEYKTLIKAKEDKIQAMIQTYQTQKKDLQAKAASLSEDKALDMQRNLKRMETDIKREQEDAERETKNLLNERLDTFRKELAPLIRAVAKEMNLDIVMNYGPQSGLVYFKENVNITDNVIKKYDEMQ